MKDGKQREKKYGMKKKKKRDRTHEENKDGEKETQNQNKDKRGRKKSWEKLEKVGGLLWSKTAKNTD